MGVSKESISKFLIGNRFHVKLRFLSPENCKQSVYQAYIRFDSQPLKHLLRFTTSLVRYLWVFRTNNIFPLNFVVRYRAF